MKKLFLILFVCVAILTLAGCNKEKQSDALKFKNEYESLNGKKSSNGKIIKKIKIDKNNPIKYSDFDEVLDVIKKGTGIVYLGFPECPWCRTALPVLLEAAKDYKIDTIYYINVTGKRDEYEVKNGKVVYKKDEYGKEIKGDDGYLKLLKVLDKELDDYVITDNKGKEYKVGEKRIYVPLIIFVNEGKIVGTHTSTVKSQKNGYDELSDDQYDELSGIYADYIKELVNNYCDEAC
jgi:thiol-disulfide isomerase/thioredoxin